MIELQSFTKSYGNTVAAEDVSFIAPSCCVTALAGLNGAGKTTVLKAVCSMHYADSGSVRVNGIDAHDFPIKNKSQIGFVSEQSNFHGEYTVFEFLLCEVAVILSAVAKKQRLQEVFSVTELCSLQEVVFKRIKTLSKGYRQRLSLARCLLGNPSVLVLDEPTSGLDPRQIVEMRNLIENLAVSKTVLISTHLMQEMQALCSHIAVMHKGRLEFFGSEKDLCIKTAQPDLETAFLKLTETAESGVCA
ncbi:MAG: ABC transporter ATP-binding protein [Spirochaetales bacterium]